MKRFLELTTYVIITVVSFVSAVIFPDISTIAEAVSMISAGSTSVVIADIVGN